MYILKQLCNYFISTLSCTVHLYTLRISSFVFLHITLVNAAYILHSRSCCSSIDRTPSSPATARLFIAFLVAKYVHPPWLSLCNENTNMHALIITKYVFKSLFRVHLNWEYVHVSVWRCTRVSTLHAVDAPGGWSCLPASCSVVWDAAL